MLDGTCAFAADLAAAPWEAKLAQLRQRATLRHGTATMPESVPGSHTEDLSKTSDSKLEGAADWVLSITLPDGETFQDRPRLEYHTDEEIAYRPDLYSDAFEVADGDLMLCDWDAEDLPDAGDTVYEEDELWTEAEGEVKVQPVMDTRSIDAFKGMSLLLVPTAPQSPAPSGFVRKYRSVLVLSLAGKEASEPEPAFTKIPQGSALTAVAALRTGNESVRGSNNSASSAGRPHGTW